MELIDPGFWERLTVRALSPKIVYVGRFPERSRDYYALTPLVSARTAYVYMLFSYCGSLLYVGRARRPGNRFDKHRRRDWWPEVYDVLLVQVQGEDRASTHAYVDKLERLAIRHLSPIHNVAGVAV